METISEQLRREMPGLRGFSATQMKDMRRFYEEWQMLDSNPWHEKDELKSVILPVATDEITLLNSNDNGSALQDGGQERRRLSCSEFRNNCR